MLREACDIMNVELLHQIGPVMIDRFGRKLQVMGDLLAAASTGQQAKDVFFPAGELNRAGFAILPVCPGMVNDLPGVVVRPTHHRTERIVEHRQRIMAVKHAMRLLTQRQCQHFVTPLPGEHEQTNLRMLRMHPSYQRDATHVLKATADQQQIRRLRGTCLQHLRTAGILAGYLHLPFMGDGEHQQLPQEALAFGDHHRGFHLENAANEVNGFLRHQKSGEQLVKKEIGAKGGCQGKVKSENLMLAPLENTGGCPVKFPVADHGKHWAADCKLTRIAF